MLTLITGQPGNGKTLHALGLVEGIRKQSGRLVYQHGVPELALDWRELSDPATWYEVPPGSIVLIDECQKTFPPRKQGAAVPKHVAEFETHRHLGLDVYLLTQHPQLLDIAVRKLVGRHVHVVRKFGSQTAKLMQWERCVDPHDRAVQRDALVTSFKFNPLHFQWYRSAEIHTVKRDFPMRKMALLVGSLTAVVALMVFAFLTLGRQESTVELDQVPNAEISSPVAQPAVMRYGTWKARIEARPWTAPVYDELAQLVTAPRLTGCMRLDWSDGRIECRCSTQQGTVLPLDDAACLAVMRTGVFDPLREDIDVKAENIKRLDAATPSPSESGSAEPQIAPPPRSSPPTPLTAIAGG